MRSICVVVAAFVLVACGSKGGGTDQTITAGTFTVKCLTPVAPGLWAAIDPTNPPTQRQLAQAVWLFQTTADDDNDSTDNSSETGPVTITTTINGPICDASSEDTPVITPVVVVPPPGPAPVALRRR